MWRNIEAEWLEFLLRIQEASGSMQGPQTGYFYSIWKANCCISSIKQANTAAFNTDK